MSQGTRLLLIKHLIHLHYQSGRLPIRSILLDQQTAMESLPPGEAAVVQLIFTNAHQLLLKHLPTQSHRSGRRSSLSKLPQIQNHNQFLASFSLNVLFQ